MSIRVHLIHTGSVNVDQGVPFKEGNPLAFTGFFRPESKRVTLPVSCYLIEHPKGLILIDTGWGKEEENKEVKKVLNQSPVSIPLLAPNEAIVDRLAALKIKPSDLDYVFITHMDSDHIGGLKDVKEAKQIYCSAPEWKDVKRCIYAPRYPKALYEGVDIKTFTYAPSPFGPRKSAYDVFGDGTLILVSTPGHTHGEFTALVNGEKGFLAIIGDTGYARESYERLIPPGITVNKKMALESLKWVASLKEDPSCLGIWASHDPELSPQIVEL